MTHEEDTVTAEAIFNTIINSEYTVDEIQMIQRAVGYVKRRLASRIAQKIEIKIGRAVEFRDEYGRYTFGRLIKIHVMYADIETKKGIQTIPLLDIKVPAEQEEQTP